MKLFGAHLGLLAQSFGVSNAVAARRAGLAERRFNNYRDDQREPDLATLTMIARVLKRVPNYLLVFDHTPDMGERAKLIARVNSAALMLPDNELDLVAFQLDAFAAHRKNSPPTGL